MQEQVLFSCTCTLLLLTDCYRSFNVDRLNSANKIARIKNRNTIFDSFQSCISK